VKKYGFLKQLGEKQWETPILLQKASEQYLQE